jgi:hypothetical protein
VDLGAGRGALGLDHDETAVTAVQVRDVVTRPIAAGHWPARKLALANPATWPARRSLPHSEPDHSAGIRWGSATFKFYEGRDILGPVPQAHSGHRLE